MPTGPDHLGRDAHARFLAEVVAHRAADTPLCVGIFGPAGSGKSSFLAALLSAVEAIDRAAVAAGLATVFHGGMVVARVTARPGVSAAHALVSAVGAALSRTYPRLLGRVAHAGADARSVAREAAEALNAARTRLDTERQSLDGLAGRRARLADTILFETEGSGVDAFVRGRRGRIERRMRGFGVTHEPMTAFKETVRDAHESTAPMARASGGLRAFYAYKGQGRLLVWAVVLFVAAWALAALSDSQDGVLATVQSGGDKMSGMAEGLKAQWHWLAPAAHLLEICALAAVAANIVRGIAFLLPVQRGVGLLRTEVESRRRELDSRLAHQTRRVDDLVREVERLGRHAAEADSRLPPPGAEAAPVLSVGSGPDRDGLLGAQLFFAALEDAIGERQPADGSKVPARLVVGLDGLEHLSSVEAAAFVETATALAARPGMVLVMAGDRTHLANGLAETDPALAAERLRRIVQVPFDLRADETWTGAAAYARALITPGDVGGADGDAAVEAAVSALDRPWTGAELAVLEAVAPLAGSTPRAVKQLVNLYRIARADPLMRESSPKDLAALALGLALQANGMPPQLASYTGAGEAEEVFAARRAVGAALGTPFSALDGRLGMEVARTYGTGR